MPLRELNTTLTALVEAVIPPLGSGLQTTEAEMKIPLEVQGLVVEGQLVLFAAPPSSRWVSGFQHQTNQGRLQVVSTPTIPGQPNALGESREG